MNTTEATATLELEPAARRGMVVRGILFNWGSLLVSALVSFILTPLLIRSLGQYYYGMWVLVVSVTDQYGLLDLGMTPALSRFAGYFQGSKDRSGLNEIFSAAFLLTLLVSLLVCCVTALLAPFLPSFFSLAATDRPTFVRLIILLGLTTAVAFPERMLAAYLRGIQRFDLFNTAATSATVIRALFIGVALRLGFGVIAIATITLGMALVSFTLHFVMIRWADPGLQINYRRGVRARLRQLFSFSVYVFIGSIGTRLISRIDSIVIGRILSLALIAPFNVASRLTDYFVGVFGGMQGPVLSAMSELDGASKQEELRELFLRTSRYCLLLALLMGSVLLLNGRELLAFWLGSSGLDLKLTYRVLLILTFCHAATQVQLPAWSVIYARARHQLLAALVLAEGIANLGLSVYWGYRYGLVGIALGSMVPALVHHLLIIPFYASRVIELPVARCLINLVRPLAAGALYIGIWLSAMAQPRSPLALLLSVMCQIISFGIIIYPIALTGDEKKRFWRWCRRLFRINTRRNSVV